MGDTQSRKWQLTVNNPEEKGWTHSVIKKILEDEIKNVTYWCMCDEVGAETQTYHTHLFIFRKNAIRFSKVQKAFGGFHIEQAKGTCEQNRDYIRKEGKHGDKSETNLRDTFEESGEMPVESQGKRTDLHVLYELIKDGNSDYEILEHNPFYMNRLGTISQVRETLRYEEFRNVRRLDMHVEYWFGAPGAGKTRGVLDRYGDTNVYMVTDYSHPWDDYRGEDVVLFDDIDTSRVTVNDLLRWLDVYPLRLPCRYNNKSACYTKVFITSNLPLDCQYTHVQENEPSVWKALLRRVHCVKEFGKDGFLKSYETMEQFTNRHKTRGNGGFVQLSLGDADKALDMFGDPTPGHACPADKK